MRFIKTQRRGFTLVELLVVISIIGVLMSLTLPAVNSAREAGRNVACKNNIGQVGKALRVYESTKNKFPGWAGNKIKSNTTNGVSWAVALLPFLDDKADPPVTTTYREIFVCQSDPPDRPTDPQTSYVVNAGWDTDNKREAGVCTSNTPDTIYNGISKINTFSDGLTQTILVTENLNAGKYSDTSRHLVGAMWVQTPDLTANPELKVNGRWSGWNIGTANTTATDKNRARPSSFHPGGANTVFCDSSVKFLREDIDYTVYRSLMTSSGGKNGVTADVTVSDSDFTNQ